MKNLDCNQIKIFINLEIIGEEKLYIYIFIYLFKSKNLSDLYKKNFTYDACEILVWGQFLPRPSVALVVIFGLESPTLKGKPSSSCHIRDSGILSPLVIHYMT